MQMLEDYLYCPQNLVDLEKGPLPEELVTALDEAWRVVQSPDIIYWR